MFYALAIIPNGDVLGPLSESLTVPDSAKYVNPKYVDTVAGLTDQAKVGYRLDVASRHRDRVAGELPGDTHTICLVAILGDGQRFEVVLGSGVRCAL